jgi:hypothetical protein
VRYEVGRAHVVPFFERPVTSFVHQHLDRIGIIGEFTDNRPLAMRCVHPLVTLLEKLDALSRRYGHETIEADGFVRRSLACEPETEDPAFEVQSSRSSA